MLRGAATQGGTPPYGPLVAALRSRLRAQPGALDGVGPLRAQLALLLPELGEPATAADRPTLFEALRAGYAHLAAAAPAVVLLDDLQWSDEATLEVLAALAEPLGELPLLVLAAYRSDGLPRSHGLRRLRNDLRRAGTLEELVLGPLTEEETAALLAEALGAAPDPALAAAIHARAQGIPFFAEELAEAIRRGDEPQGLPDTVRDAVLVAAAELSPDGRAAAEVAAVAGEAFAPEQVAALAGDAGLGELLERGLVYEGATGETCFRHALAREALYADVPWARRRTLHRALAEELERTGGHSGEVAEHWLGAREPERARAALLRAASESEAVHAYRDAVLAGRRALELWPPGADAARRAEVLERYARCCQPAGDLAEAAGAWRELVALRTDAGDRRAVAQAQRGLAAALELAGERDAALAARTRGGGGVRRDGRSRRGRRGAAGDRQPAPAVVAARRGRRAGPHRARRRRRRRPAGPAAARDGDRGHGAGQARRLPRRARDGPQRARARARARPHGGRRRALPAPERDALRGGRAAARPRPHSTPRWRSAARARTRAPRSPA